MECPRCHGLMVTESFLHNLTDLDSLKCLNCGNIITSQEKPLEFDTFSMFYHQEKFKNK